MNLRGICIWQTLHIILTTLQPSNSNASTTNDIDIDPNKIKSFSILSSHQITKELKDLEEQYPNLASLTTSQEEYDLPTAGNSKDCTFDNDTDGCYNYFLTIQDFVAHPYGSKSYQTLPEVLLSGALHGNERVGPTAVVEAARLLLDAASCEALPYSIPSSIDIDSEKGAQLLLKMERGQDCRNDLISKGINDDTRKWLARLVSTRRIIIIPSANALGYDRNERTEYDIDPNRDFPFDIRDKRQCMKTIAGRTINEIFRDHLFQIALTFHGGTEVVAYEWGAPTYLDMGSPDDVAQVEIGDGYSRFAGGFDGTKKYLSGTMNDLVYPVRGGMEDWAYAGSWDPERVIQCEPNPGRFGEYSPEKTTYNESTLRAFNMLIETSHSKIPHSHLGTSEGLLSYNAKYKTNGHIARNIRLALMAIDIVEPYVSITGLDDVELVDDVVPLMNDEESCQKSKLMSVPSGTEEVTVNWTVAGGFTVDFTTIYYAKWNDIPSTIHCFGHPLDSEIGPEFQTTQALSGITRWHKDTDDITKATFQSTINISDFNPGDKIAVFATARLDQGWTDQPDDNIAPKLPPMSHLVNARSRDDWFHESAGKIIQGRIDWYSIPLTILISDESSDEIVDLSERSIISDLIASEPNDEDDDLNNGFSSYKPVVILAMLLASAVTIVCLQRIFWRVCTRKVKYMKSSSFDDDDEFTNGLTYEEEIQLREMS